jgi:FAD/FMN-containing dehydrogenase
MVLVQDKCSFAIKSGGHMSFEGANGMNDGITLDLGLLRTLELSEDRSVVSLGTGLISNDVYLFFENTGLVIPGGVCGTTGIGGLSLGGGQSYFQPRVGWLIDNIVAHEIVLASGEVVLANQTHHDTLYRALKGGGSNFGIVTRVDVATFEQGDVWGGQVVLPATDELVEELLHNVIAYTAANNEMVDAGLQAGIFFLADGRKAIVMTPVATDGQVDACGKGRGADLGLVQLVRPTAPRDPNTQRPSRREHARPRGQR